MAIAPKTIAMIVGGVVLVGGGFVAAPVLGDLFTQSVAPSTAIIGEPVEFAVNENGETYGSPINDRVPELIVTRAEGGKTGYVRVSELDLARNASRSNPDPNAVYNIDVYESDGTTTVGTFRVTDDTPGPRDGFNN
ncbi:hypothetical protein [Microcella sp.]|uniref:hypothetical protein n=1 Tax=Microcella sp. TaxID=1913979 RepID=UPI003F70FEAD